MTGLDRTILEPLYPKSDETIWLRTCEEDIIEPLDAKITGE